MYKLRGKWTAPRMCARDNTYLNDDKLWSWYIRLVSYFDGCRGSCWWRWVPMCHPRARTGERPEEWFLHTVIRRASPADYPCTGAPLILKAKISLWILEGCVLRDLIKISSAFGAGWRDHQGGCLLIPSTPRHKNNTKRRNTDQISGGRDGGRSGSSQASDK